MWLCMNDAFLSVVADRNDEGNLLVRARVKGHIEKVFPKAKTFTSNDSDYMYRAFIDREDVAIAVYERLMEVEYDNFKSSVKNRPLHDAYLKVWHIMYGMQPIKKLKSYKLFGG